MVKRNCDVEMDVGYRLITNIENLLCAYVCMCVRESHCNLFLTWQTLLCCWLKQDNCLCSVSQFIQLISDQMSKNPHLLIPNTFSCCRFEIAIFVLIVLNMLTMGIEHYNQPHPVRFVLEVSNAFFTTVFGLGKSTHFPLTWTERNKSGTCEIWGSGFCSEDEGSRSFWSIRSIRLPDIASHKTAFFKCVLM